MAAIRETAENDGVVDMNEWFNRFAFDVLYQKPEDTDISY